MLVMESVIFKMVDDTQTNLMNCFLILSFRNVWGTQREGKTIVWRTWKVCALHM